MRRYYVPLVLSLALAACGGKEQQGGAPPPPEVGVVKLQARSVPLQRDLVGRLAAFRSADVRARVPGVLQRRVYEEGSDVTQGQLLFVIDPAPLQAALAQSQAALAQSQANHTNAKVAAERARQLAPGKFISQSDLDNALATERSAAASVQAGKAAVESARINLGYASVRAPIAGRAGKQQVTEGALVGQGTATLLTTVDQIDPLFVNFSMGVTELQQIRGMRQGQAPAETQVQVLLPDGTVYGRPGVLDFSGDIVDPATGAVSLRARIPNPDKTLLPGTYVTLRATLGQQPNVFLVPQLAVQRDANSAYVLVVGQDGKVARKDIVTERSQGTAWVVSQGVAAGDQVIVSGLQKAQPGQPAKAVPWQPEAAKGAAPGANPDAKKEGDAAAKKG
ncbi:membrane fusion protein (multidrug efflux system) [Luteimonas cucumeris]|uniref:Membrane fusion protein (Multidrug efflux system) n=1 Tax=Luteimonas cucumeris TaxID=985012 RepID=A0A562LEI2_9GAMM|nr:efflux RND transporter periplasmic adaptor subunit [Luteimonas cucumeris]TWI06057.1 membrane fusion protein (multidrug efflux system) [Luteimonas cucumeris]